MTYINYSRRNFLKGLTATSVLSAGVIPVFAIPPAGEAAGEHGTASSSGSLSTQANGRPVLFDGPGSSLFEILEIKGNASFSSLKDSLSGRMASAVEKAPSGKGTAWGIPFQIPENPVLLTGEPYTMQVPPITCRWLAFLHTSDRMDAEEGKQLAHDLPYKGPGQLNEHMADYIVLYADGSEERVEIRQRHQIGMFLQWWGENSLLSVTAHKPLPQRAHHEQASPPWGWGTSQTRVNASDRGDWINWLWAWENPHPGKQVTGIRFEPLGKADLVISAVSFGHTESNPLRWEPRQKAILRIPDGASFHPDLSGNGLLADLQLDMGQVISAAPRLQYSSENWDDSYNNKIPEVSDNEIIIEYTAHPEAAFHLADGTRIPVSEIDNLSGEGRIRALPPARQDIRIRVVDKRSGQAVAVKLHVHGESDEYLAPVNRHRIPNNAWFEDYSVDFVHNGTHVCSYIEGETNIKLPLGKVYIEVSKGFEIRPVRKVFNITADTREVVIELEKVLYWREKSWVSADTHVHFLSPNSALLEGAAEGVNIINLLASQWGELFTNIGDFDGKTTVGSKEAGGDGEYLVRVGTENRQHVLGHISLLGYKGDMITPLTTGGADESALGDPIEVLLTEWAEQCRKQDGLVIIPHFPNPRLENAAAIASGNVHGIEMTSWNNLYYGIDPYSLADWYRYLNCGYFVAAVGGTDKMGANTAVGTVRTYARIPDDREFTYDEWMEAVKKGHTFVTYGPLIDFRVEGKPMGSRFGMPSGGGMVDVEWEAASVTTPLSRVELIVNGEVRESLEVSPDNAEGRWSTRIEKSSWLALLVRGHYPEKPEIITAHSSPVMIDVDGSEMLAAADALTILEQIEGAIAYFSTIGTRTEEKTYKRMLLLLESTHREVHNRMHHLGHYHRHTPLNDHPGHQV